MRRLLAVVLVAFVLHAWWLACVAEDAYITYRFARNVAEGHGFVWNIGEPPVEGFTNFLWLLICAAGYKLGLDLPRFTQIIGACAGLVTLFYAWRFSIHILGVPARIALFTTALLAAAGPVALWATSGMETVFFTMWVTLAVFYASRFPQSAATGDVVLAGLCLLLATLTRPEGFGIFAIVLGVAFVGGRLSDRGKRAAWLLAATYLPAFLFYFAWRYRVFGYLLPNAFYAKTGGGIHQYWRGLVYAGYFALHFLAPCSPWVVLWAWRLADDESGWTGLGGWRAAILRSCRQDPGIWIAGAVIAGYVGNVILVGGDYMAMYRFFVPVLPLTYSLFGVVVQRAVAGIPLTARRRVTLAALVLTSLGGVLLQSTPYEQAVFAGTPRMHGTYRGVGIERWHVNRFHVIAQFLDRQKRDDADSVLTHDIGVIGYVTRFRIYDALGIVDPTIAHGTPQGAMGLGLAGHEKQDLAYSFSRQPTFVMYTVQLRPLVAAWPNYPPDLARRVQAEYQLKSVWLTDRANHEEGYFTYLERRRDFRPAAAFNH